MFFPGSGGKPTKAKTFCSTCPVQKLCLQESIEQGLEGFWVGTTDKDRIVMAAIHRINVVSITEALPPEPDRNKRKVYRKLVISEDPHEWLDKVEGPKESDLNVA